MPQQTLTLSQSQQLQMVLAPQLRQSLEMLQVPIMELRSMIQSELEKNPTLEEIPNEKETIEIEPGKPGEREELEKLDFDKEFEAIARLDDEWRDYFYQNLQNNSYNPAEEEKHQYLMDSLPQTESLQEHLMNQFNLAGFSDFDRQVGELIIGSIDDDGYLTATLEEIAESACCDLAHLEDILHVIQEFHPTGVGARDLRECLLIQLEREERKDSLAYRIVDQHLHLLAGRKYNELAKALKVPLNDIKKASETIASLDPKPGRIYSEEVATYVFPEVVVEKINGQYAVILDDDQLPHIRIASHYRKLLSDPNTKDEVKAYVRERIRSGAFLIKSIHQRQKTIRKIATEIVERQRGFLDHGIQHLKPLTMSEVAEKAEVHETTVSRAVNGKYMRTPKGLFEMKYFFTPGIKTADGGSISNKTVKDMIADLVSEENPTAPLSDKAIVDALKAEGIKIARRTVAKYRIMMRIPPSHLRKGFA